MCCRNSREGSSRSHSGTGIHISSIRSAGLPGNWKSRYILSMYMNTKGEEGASSKPVDKREPILHFLIFHKDMNISKVILREWRQKAEIGLFPPGYRKQSTELTFCWWLFSQCDS